VDLGNFQIRLSQSSWLATMQQKCSTTTQVLCRPWLSLWLYVCDGWVHNNIHTTPLNQKNRLNLRVSSAIDYGVHDAQIYTDFVRGWVGWWVTVQVEPDASVNNSTNYMSLIKRVSCVLRKGCPCLFVLEATWTGIAVADIRGEICITPWCHIPVQTISPQRYVV
jgi:hypothetical protein